MCLALIITVICGDRVRGGASEPVSTASLKAAFLYNFAKFVEWPAESSAGPLALCVTNDAAVADALEQLAGGRPINGRESIVVRLAAPRNIRTCHLAYLGGDDVVAYAHAIDVAFGNPVLTVGDGEQFVRLGGIVGFYVEDGRMRFAIGGDSARRSGLRLSSQLLGLAKLMKDERHGQS